MAAGIAVGRLHAPRRCLPGDLLKHFGIPHDDVLLVLEAGWPGISNMAIQRDYRFSIAALGENEQCIPNTTIMINTYDSWHIENHIAPLRKGRVPRTLMAGSVKLRFFSSKASGYNSLPVSGIVPVIKELNGIG